MPTGTPNAIASRVLTAIMLMVLIVSSHMPEITDEQKGNDGSGDYLP